MVGSEQVVVTGVDGGLGAVAQAEAVENAGDVVLHGALAQVEPSGDLSVVQPGRDLAQDVDLPWGQVRGRGPVG